MKRFISLFFIVVYTVGVFASSSPIEKRKGRNKAVKKIMTVMTEKQMIGQLFMIDSYAVYDSLQVSKVRKQIQENYIGGVCFFKGNSADLIKLNKLYNEMSKVPLFVAIDGEWGLSMRLKDMENFPMAMTMGALPYDKYDLVYNAGENIALACKS